MVRFHAELRPVPGGGCYVAVPETAVVRAGLRYGARVRGTLNGVSYRSSLMKYGGIFHLGVHKATLAEAKVSKVGTRVTVDIEIDPEPPPGEAVPPDLAKAIAASADAKDGWEAMAPSARREHVKDVLGAKKPETRTRRIEKVVLACVERAKTLTTARPPRR
jgi:hypothetical protein